MGINCRVSTSSHTTLETVRACVRRCASAEAQVCLSGPVEVTLPDLREADRIVLKYVIKLPSCTEPSVGGVRAPELWTPRRVRPSCDPTSRPCSDRGASIIWEASARFYRFRCFHPNSRLKDRTFVCFLRRPVLRPQKLRLVTTALPFPPRNCPL